jgi:hypothetical protein
MDLENESEPHAGESFEEEKKSEVDHGMGHVGTTILLYCTA